MALSGLEIFKMLPKTNCKDCGFPTCLAFGMQLAAGKVELEKCPHISEEAKKALSEASQPPILKVEVGEGDDSFVVGEETVMFRHDRTFVNQNAFAVAIDDDIDTGKIEEILKDVNAIAYERVGQILKVDAVCIKNKSKNKEKFLKVVGDVALLTKKPLILVSEDPETLKSAAGMFKGDFYNQVLLRMAAIKQKNRLFGYPTIVFPGEMTNDPLKETLIASVFVAKYGSIIVLSNASSQNIFPLLVYRQNIYTDPRRPMQVEQKIYEIGSPNESSTVLVTTNFSLTYFIISGEVESSKVPSWLLVMDVEGQSVLTAWAAGKF